VIGTNAMNFHSSSPKLNPLTLLHQPYGVTVYTSAYEVYTLCGHPQNSLVHPRHIACAAHHEVKVDLVALYQKPRQCHIDRNRKVTESEDLP